DRCGGGRRARGTGRPGAPPPRARSARRRCAPRRSAAPRVRGPPAGRARRPRRGGRRGRRRGRAPDRLAPDSPAARATGVARAKTVPAPPRSTVAALLLLALPGDVALELAVDGVADGADEGGPVLGRPAHA